MPATQDFAAVPFPKMKAKRTNKPRMRLPPRLLADDVLMLEKLRQGNRKKTPQSDKEVVDLRNNRHYKSLTALKRARAEVRFSLL